MTNADLRLINRKTKKSNRHSKFPGPTRAGGAGVIRHFKDAQRYLVGGVNSPVRAFKHVGGNPLMLASGRGATVRDTTGRTYRDYIMGWGALILGHQHPAVMKRLKAALQRGTVLGLTTYSEIELAHLIISAVPSIEQVRFTTSGTEACMTAVRLAQAATGRKGVLAFDGCYHGHSDLLMNATKIPYNDRETLERALSKSPNEFACVILEPVAANMGVIPPHPGYLQRVRALTRRAGIVLIFDEVVTGFRVGLSGAQGFFGVVPDLTVFGKIIGGGLPIGALGGPRVLMEMLAPVGKLFHGGTFAGHPLSMAAGIATLQQLRQELPYDALEARKQRLAQGLEMSARRAGLPLQVNHVGSMLTVFFAKFPVRAYAHTQGTQNRYFASWTRKLRARGILIPPSPYEAMFLSTAHTDRDVDHLLSVSAKAFQSLVTAR